MKKITKPEQLEEDTFYIDMDNDLWYIKSIKNNKFLWTFYSLNRHNRLRAVELLLKEKWEDKGYEPFEEAKAILTNHGPFLIAEELNSPLFKVLYL